MAIFEADTQDRRSTAAKYTERHIKAPFVRSGVSTLGGVQRASIMIKVSLDPKSKWVNGIYENSQYVMFRLDRDGTLEQFARSYRLPKKMRKQKATSLADAVQRINKYLSSVK